jgi:hypothetical protein
MMSSNKIQLVQIVEGEKCKRKKQIIGIEGIQITLNRKEKKSLFIMYANALSCQEQEKHDMHLLFNNNNTFIRKKKKD